MKFRLSSEQFDALMDYIDARIDEKICSDHGRDTLNESIRSSDLRGLLQIALVEGEE
jgi:hypothetical protein